MRKPFIRTSAIVVGVVLVGVLLQPSVRAAAKAVTYDKLGIFARVLTLVENNYVEEVNSRDLIYGAVKGMLSTLDPHSVFMTPEEYEEMKVDTNGEFGGIGLEVTIQKEKVVVVSPIDDTPAHRAGLRAGDVLLKIDGKDLEDLSLQDAVRMMRGPTGTKVVLTIMREGFGEPRDLAIVRDHIRVNPVSMRLVDGFAVIRIKSFQDRTDRYVRNALADVRKQSGGEIKGVVLDLRNNPGGLLDQAVAVADLWLTGGVIVSTRGRGGHKEVQRAHRANSEPNYPMVVLVNGGSASASEIVAAALRDQGRAVLMGTQTFGKGSVQTVIDLEDGSGLKLTIARYYTPNNQSIQEHGIRPDVEVQELALGAVESETKRERDLPGHLAPEGELGEPAAAAGDEVEDLQLKSALDALRSWQIFRAGVDRRTKRADAR